MPEAQHQSLETIGVLHCVVLWFFHICFKVFVIKATAEAMPVVVMICRCEGLASSASALANHADTWTPKVCKIIAFMAIIMGLGPLFYILWGFRYQIFLKALFIAQVFLSSYRTL